MHQLEMVSFPLHATFFIFIFFLFVIGHDKTRCFFVILRYVARTQIHSKTVCTRQKVSGTRMGSTLVSYLYVYLCNVK